MFSKTRRTAKPSHAPLISWDRAQVSDEEEVLRTEIEDPIEQTILEVSTADSLATRGTSFAPIPTPLSRTSPGYKAPFCTTPLT